MAHNIVMDLINALPGNSFVNMNTGNNRRETLFSMWSAHGAVGSPLPGNAAVNMHPKQWEMVFSVGSF
jgi:hypothetical protein